MTGPMCTVELSAVDAIGVGHSIRSLIRSRRIPPGCSEQFERVARQLIASARVAVVQDGAR